MGIVLIVCVNNSPFKKYLCQHGREAVWCILAKETRKICLCADTGPPQRAGTLVDWLLEVVLSAHSWEVVDSVGLTMNG